MAEKKATVKKTAAKKAPAKSTAAKSEAPKKAPAKKAAAKPEPTHEQIAELARHYFHERGGHHGHAEHDWLRAERELKGH